MRRQLLYPRVIWTPLIGMALLAWVPVFSNWMIVASLFLAAGFPAVRNWYLNPIGAVDLGYYKWLQTTPYHPAMPLPNGNPLPNWQDALVILLLAANFLPFAFRESELMSLLLMPHLFLAMGIFSFITARQLLNFGPRWISYFIGFLLLLPFHIVVRQFRLEMPFDQMLQFAALSILPAFVVAWLGLKNILARYPWPTIADKHGTAAGFRYQELLWNYSDVSQAGEPFTVLRPDARWPAVKWSDALWIAALGISAGILLMSRDANPFIFSIVCLPPVFVRYKCYFTTRHFRLGMLNFIRRQQRPNASIPILVLLGMVVFGIMVIHNRPIPGNTFATAAYIGLVYIAALKMPPSRRVWETTGGGQLVVNPGEMARGYSKRNQTSTPTVSTSV